MIAKLINTPAISLAIFTCSFLGYPDYYALVWIFNSFLLNPFWIVHSAPIMTDTTVMFHFSFSLLLKIRYLSIFKILSLLLYYTGMIFPCSRNLAWIKCPECQNVKRFSFSKTDSGLFFFISLGCQLKIVNNGTRVIGIRTPVNQ